MERIGERIGERILGEREGTGTSEERAEGRRF
jgi:hypothetical protein